jgi:hypothetical protein
MQAGGVENQSSLEGKHPEPKQTQRHMTAHNAATRLYLKHT